MPLIYWLLRLWIKKTKEVRRHIGPVAMEDVLKGAEIVHRVRMHKLKGCKVWTN